MNAFATQSSYEQRHRPDGGGKYFEKYQGTTLDKKLARLRSALLSRYVSAQKARLSPALKSEIEALGPLEKGELLLSMQQTKSNTFFSWLGKVETMNPLLIIESVDREGADEHKVAECSLERRCAPATYDLCYSIYEKLWKYGNVIALLSGEKVQEDDRLKTVWAVLLEAARLDGRKIDFESFHRNAESTQAGKSSKVMGPDAQKLLDDIWTGVEKGWAFSDQLKKRVRELGGRDRLMLWSKLKEGRAELFNGWVEKIMALNEETEISYVRGAEKSGYKMVRCVLNEANLEATYTATLVAYTKFGLADTALRFTDFRKKLKNGRRMIMNEVFREAVRMREERLERKAAIGLGQNK